MLGSLIDTDWGNPRLRYFVQEVSKWEHSCLAVLADGYFRHTMFKKPGVDLWAWAVEWNCRLRVFGLYGHEHARNDFVGAMPKTPPDMMVGDTTNGFAMRIDTPLPDEEDLLFAVPDGFEMRAFAAPHWR
jgi:hypothetical protein